MLRRKHLMRRRKSKATPSQAIRETLVSLSTAVLAFRGKLNPHEVRALVFPESGQPRIRSEVIKGRRLLFWSDVRGIIESMAAEGEGGR